MCAIHRDQYPIDFNSGGIQMRDGCIHYYTITNLNYALNLYIFVYNPDVLQNICLRYL